MSAAVLVIATGIAGSKVPGSGGTLRPDGPTAGFSNLLSAGVGGERTPRKCHARRGTWFYYGRTNDHRARRRVARLKLSRPIVGSSCAYERWRAPRWRSRAFTERRTTARWAEFHVLREQATWREAVAEAQKPYPGTSSWLLSCSASEGGWGRWVPNSQGSGVGGWLQFMPGTFARMYGAASFDLARRGFIVPGSAHSWYSPLGQALAGAWGVTNGRSHEWAGAGCR